MKTINKYPFFAIGLIAVLLILGCNSKNYSNTISDKEFVESLKKGSKSETIQYIDSLLLLNQYKGDKLGMLYLKKGECLANKQKDKEAIQNYELALPIFEKTKNLHKQAITLMNLGSTLIFVDKRELATENLLKSLEICKATGNTTTEANVYNALAHVYFNTKEYLKSKSYIQKSIDIHTLAKDSLGLSSAYNNLAVICKNINELENALKYNKLSLELNKDINDHSAVAKSYTNLGQVYLLLNDKEKAINYYKKSASINEKYSIMNTTSLRNLGDLYEVNNETDSSIKYYNKALEIEKTSSKPLIAKKIYQGLMKNYLKNKDINNIHIYQLKIDSINKQLSDIENDKRIQFLNNQYKAISNEKELKQEIKNNTKNRIIFIAILFLIIITSLFLYQKNKNTKLKLAKEKLVLEQRVLRSQMNPHFIFNALSAIQNSLLDNDPIKSATYLSRFAKLIRQNFDFINQRSISLTDEIDALKNYMETQKLRFNNKFEYSFQISSEINTDNVKIPPLLIQPFIENSIEHGFKNKESLGKITVSISRDNSSILYSITDNGKGFESKDKDKKDHAIDVFKKRMKLIGNQEENSFKITSNTAGTQIQFKITNYENTNN